LDSAYPRFPSIIGATIIAAAILLSALILTAGTRYVAIETANEETAWLVDRLTGNLYKCQAPVPGKASCEAEVATGSVGNPKR
jgi:archaellum component FlaF (FlaF/FlaG flagellin family)